MPRAARGGAALVAWLVFALLAAAAVRAQVPVPPLTGAVVDRTGTLSAAEVRSLDETLREFARRKGSQIAVLLVPTTRPETIEQFSIRVAEAWKIGRGGVDDGVIVVVARDDREVRIEVGYGLEGAIPDAVARRIIEDYIVPRFRAGDFHGGLAAGTAALMKLIEGEQLPAPKEDWRSPSGGGAGFIWIWTLFAAMILGGILRVIFGRLVGAGITGAAVGAIGWLLAGSILVGIIAALFAFMVALAGGGPRYYGGIHRGPRIGGGFGGWGGGFGGGFGGGGGGFGGGGASGRW